MSAISPTSRARLSSGSQVAGGFSIPRGSRVSRGSRADVLGVACSLACAVHCAATPVLLSVLPGLASLRWLADPLFHQAVAVVCAVLVARAMLPGWRVHRKRSVAVLAISGVSALFAAAFVLPSPCCEHYVLSPNVTQTVITSDLRSESLRSQFLQSGALASVDSQPWGTLRFVSTQSAFKMVSNQSSNEPMRDAVEPMTADPFGRSARRNGERIVEAGFGSQGVSTSQPVSTWSRPLLTQADLLATVGPQAAQGLLTAQTYLSPLGGVLLLVAHLLNMRLRCCGVTACLARKPIAAE